MAEVERKNGTDKKHSLSSFDKRKVQLTKFEGQNSKKYRISDTAAGNAMSPEKTQRMKTAAFMQYQNKEKKPGAAASTSAREKSYSGQSQHTSNYSSNYSAKATEHSYGQSEKSSVAERKTMSPEMADRMRKAAYIQQMNKEKVKAETAASAYIYSESKSVDVPERNYYSGNEIKTAEEQTKHSDKSYAEYSDRKSAEHKGETVEGKKVISPEMAQRMKRAEYILQKNNEEIKQNIAAAKSKENDDEEDDKEEKDKSDDNNENTDGFEKLDIITGAIKGSDSVGGAVPAAVLHLRYLRQRKKQRNCFFGIFITEIIKKPIRKPTCRVKKINPISPS